MKSNIPAVNFTYKNTCCIITYWFVPYTDFSELCSMFLPAIFVELLILPLILCRCCDLRHISFPAPYILFFTVKVSLFSFFPAKTISWYKSFFRFLYIKALLSPPLLGCQPNLFVKRSLIWDDYLFLYVKISLNKFFPIHHLSAILFSFCVKTSLNKTGPYVIGRQQRVFSPAMSPDSSIFFLCVKISLCTMFSPLYLIILLSLHRYISSYTSSFIYFCVKTTLLSIFNT